MLLNILIKGKSLTEFAWIGSVGARLLGAREQGQVTGLVTPRLGYNTAWLARKNRLNVASVVCIHCLQRFICNAEHTPLCCGRVTQHPQLFLFAFACTLSNCCRPFCDTYIYKQLENAAERDGQSDNGYSPPGHCVGASGQRHLHWLRASPRHRALAPDQR